MSVVNGRVVSHGAISLHTLSAGFCVKCSCTVCMPDEACIVIPSNVYKHDIPVFTWGKHTVFAAFLLLYLE